jgi:hypothetical protein
LNILENLQNGAIKLTNKLIGVIIQSQKREIFPNNASSGSTLLIKR